MGKLDYNRKTNRTIDKWKYAKKVTLADLNNKSFVMPYGKYVGFTIQRITEMNPGYIKFLKANL